MSHTIRNKADVDMYWDRGESYPSVNVKASGWLRGLKFPLGIGGTGNPDGTITQHFTEPEFTVDWIEEHVSEDTLQLYWEFAIEAGREGIDNDAEEIFSDYRIQIYYLGRSGGHCAIKGLPDLESWDAVLLAKWRRFAKWCQQYVDDVPYQIAMSAYINDFEAALNDAANTYDPSTEGEWRTTA